MAGCLRPPPASSGEEAENRGVTAAQKPRQSGPSPALPTVTLFATAACRLIGLLGGHYPASLFASGTPSHPEPQTAGRSLGFRITKFMRKLAGCSAIFAALCPNAPNTYWRLSSRQSRLAASHHYPWQAPRRNVIPGFAGAKPGTGQTVRAIIAPASCRHDNCSAHCLIIVAYQTWPFTARLSGLCLPGDRQGRLYIMKHYANWWARKLNPGAA